MYCHKCGRYIKEGEPHPFVSRDTVECFWCVRSEVFERYRKEQQKQKGGE